MTEAQAVYATDSKVKEKAKKKSEKEAGIDRKVVKRKKFWKTTTMIVVMTCLPYTMMPTP